MHALCIISIVYRNYKINEPPGRALPCNHHCWTQTTARQIYHEVLILGLPGLRGLGFHYCERCNL